MIVGNKSIFIRWLLVASLIAPPGAGIAETGKESRTSLMAWVQPFTATVRERGTWAVEFVVKENQMKTGGALKIRFVKGFGKPQSEDSLQANYVTASTSSASAHVEIVQITNTDSAVDWDWDRNAWVVTAKVTGGNLANGDTIRVTYGANPPAGRMLAPRSAFVDEVRIACDLTGSGSYQELPLPPRIRILAGAPAQVNAYLPSNAIVGEPVLLKIIVVDLYQNLAPSFSAAMSLTSTDELAELPARLQLTASDSGRLKVPVTFHSKGVHYVSVRLLDAFTTFPTEVKTNPIMVADTEHEVAFKTYWGDLHSHSRFSHDAYGNGSFRHGREVSCLDFFASTNHTTSDYIHHGGINSEEWRQIKQHVRDYNAPGEFVTLLAYEYGKSSPSGHHNIYFNGSDQALEQVPLLREHEVGSIQTVWKTYSSTLPAGVSFFTVPHHTGIRWSPSSESAISFGPGFGDPRYRNLIEIYSAHGQSEVYDPSHALSYESLFGRKGRSSVPGPHYAQDAWAAGEILGTIASSDDHSSRPGLSYRGLTAVLANELTRDAIFNALKERRSYGTTGQRILLSFKIENQMMGSRVKIPKGEFPHVEVAVYGTDDLEFLEVLKWDNENGRWRDGHPVFEIIRWFEGSGMHLAEAFTDSTYAGDSIYYVRAKQKNDILDTDRKLERQAWAWSSPIWVSDSLLLAGDNTSKVDHLRLRRSFPNPAKGMVSIRFYLPVDGEASLELFDVLGHKVSSFFSEHQLSGWHTTHISTAALANGVYFLRLKSGNQVASKKLLLLK